jgi:hypothetical protein
VELEITKRRICPNLTCYRTPRGSSCVWVTLADGTIHPTPRRVRHHSLHGIDWGDGGSGSADLALSICAWVFPIGCDGFQAIKLRRSRCSRIAWMLHQDFLQRFIAPLPREGGDLSGAELDTWFDAALAELDRSVTLEEFLLDLFGGGEDDPPV